MCDLLFISGSNCPSCGSNLAENLADLEGLNSSDDNVIPGLEDLAEAIGDEVERDDLAAESSPTSSLPFGMGAESSVVESALPFGIGSQNVEVSVDKDDLQNHSEISSQSNSEKVDYDGEEKITKNSASPEIIEDIETKVLAEEFSPSVDVRDEISETREQSAQPKPVKVKAKPIPVDVSVHESPNVPVESVSEVPEMWRIDAAEVDMGTLYSEEEKVVEIDYGDTYQVSEVSVDLDTIHEVAPSQGDEITILGPPELHKARAMPIDTSGSPELDRYVSEGFDSLANGNWDKAARCFQKLAQQIPGNANVLNNYGLSLLHKAIGMSDSSNAGESNLAPTQFESAIMALRQAAKTEPSNNEIILNLSHALLVSGRNEKSLGVIKVYRERLPMEVEGANIEGSALLQLGRFGEAREIFESHSDDVIVRSNLARMPSI